MKRKNRYSRTVEVHPSSLFGAIANGIAGADKDAIADEEGFIVLDEDGREYYVEKKYFESRYKKMYGPESTYTQMVEALKDGKIATAQHIGGDGFIFISAPKDMAIPNQLKGISGRLKSKPKLSLFKNNEIHDYSFSMVDIDCDSWHIN